MCFFYLLVTYKVPWVVTTSARTELLVLPLVLELAGEGKVCQLLDSILVCRCLVPHRCQLMAFLAISDRLIVESNSRAISCHSLSQLRL